tara:strand:- start:1154 stop:1810 length:657 start_codon:yes stop_codon:yes gene_type:complete
MNYFWIILIILVFFGSFGQSVAEENDLVRLIQKQYQSIRSFSGHFIQSSHYAETKTGPKKAEGRVSYKRPGKMRWLYKEPEEQLLVTNGHKIWLFDPLLENVTVQKLEKITEGTALSFLLGLGNLQTDFIRRGITKNLLFGQEGLILELKPKKNTANLDFIQLNVNSETYNLQSIALMDLQNNYRIIQLLNIKYNLEIEDNFFEFTVTKDMEVIEAEN